MEAGGAGAVSTYWADRPDLYAGEYPTGAQLEALLDQIEYAQAVGGNSTGISNAGATDTTTSSSYASLAAPSSFSFTKRYSTTRLRVVMSMGLYCATSSSSVGWGVSINATNFDVGQMLINTLNNHELYTATRYIAAASVPAGTYNVQGIWKRVSGTGTLTRDSSDWLSIDVTEVDA